MVEHYFVDYYHCFLEVLIAIFVTLALALLSLQRAIYQLGQFKSKDYFRHREDGGRRHLIGIKNWETDAAICFRNTRLRGATGCTLFVPHKLNFKISRFSARLFPYLLLRRQQVGKICLQLRSKANPS